MTERTKPFHLCIKLPFHLDFTDELEAVQFLQAAVPDMKRVLDELALLFTTVTEPETGWFPGVKTDFGEHDSERGDRFDD